MGDPFKVEDMLNSDAIKTRWMAAFVNTWTPGKVKSYLGSLLAFYRYLITQAMVASNDVLITMMEKVKEWTRGLRKRSQIRRSQIAADSVSKCIHFLFVLTMNLLYFVIHFQHFFL